MLRLDYQSAVKNLENVLTQNADYVGEVLAMLKYAYDELNQLENFELFLIRATQMTKNGAVDLALADLVAEKYGIVAAQTSYTTSLNRIRVQLFSPFYSVSN